MKRIRNTYDAYQAAKNFIAAVDAIDLAATELGIEGGGEQILNVVGQRALYERSMELTRVLAEMREGGGG